MSTFLELRVMTCRVLVVEVESDHPDPEARAMERATLETMGDEPEEIEVTAQNLVGEALERSKRHADEVLLLPEGGA